jgi:hypothetical protein
LVQGAALVEQELQSGGTLYRAAFVTLTYRPGVDYDPRQISEALNCLRVWCERRGVWFRYVWRLEFGEVSGRLHYHVVVWLPRGISMPAWDTRGWWSHGMTQFQWARKPVGYLSKVARYAAKAAAASSEEFHTKGARWWGIGGITRSTRVALRLVLAPGWVRDMWAAMGCDGVVGRLAHGWWRIGGWEFRSPWELVSFDPGGVTIRWRGWDQWDFAAA